MLLLPVDIKHHVYIAYLLVIYLIPHVQSILPHNHLPLCLVLPARQVLLEIVHARVHLRGVVEEKLGQPLVLKKGQALLELVQLVLQGWDFRLQVLQESALL
jgi:hypothetical protein